MARAAAESASPAEPTSSRLGTEFDQVAEGRAHHGIVLADQYSGRRAGDVTHDHFVPLTCALRRFDPFARARA